MRLVSLVLVLLAAAPLAAQTPGSCALGTAEGDLITPNLFARLFNTGSLFFGNQSEAAYVVPRNTGNSSVFAAGLWVGGRVGGEVRTAAARYGNFQFWPGPLDAGAALPNPTDCSAFDRIFVVSPADVAAFEASGSASADLAAWPVGLGAPAVTAAGQPVAVTSRGQVLNLAMGERPVLYGGPTAFWVMNDVGNDTLTGGFPGTPSPRLSAPLGIEVQATAFVPAFGSRRQSTFYRYTVVNRGAQPIEDLHVGFFADTDLGSFDDDYVGSDSTRGMAYTYNGAATDAQYGVPPALGFDVLSGMRSAAYFRNGPSGGPATDPDTPPAYYNYLSGLWGDGTPMRALSDGYDEPASAPVTRFMFPADPIANQPWSEENPGPGLTRNEPADRRFSVAAPAVTLAPGASTTVDMGILFAQGTDRFDSLTRLRALSDQTQLAYDLGLVYSGGLPEGTLAAPALVAPAANTQFYEAPAVFEWAPVGGAEAYLLEISETPDFAGAGGELSTETTQTLSADGFRANRTAPLYWRVRAFAGGEVSPPSEARLFRVYRYVPGPETLESGAYAFVETTAPGGGPACEPDDPDEGCAEVQGDLVYRSPNSTGDYSLDFTPAGIDGLIGFSGVDYEIRFTDAGSVAYTTESPRRLFRVPFELWTVTGAVPGGPAPGKQRRLIPRLSFVWRIDTTPGPVCRFAFGASRIRSPNVEGYDTPQYDEFAAVAEPLVAASPTGCPSGTAADPAISLIDDPDFAYLVGPFYFEKTGTRELNELTGSTVRIYTADLVVSSEGSVAAPGASALRAAYPNPASTSLTVPYTVASAGPVRLRVVDVLGRTVAVLADGVQAAGEHEARLDARALAAGVYALVLEAGDQRATRTVTVVR